MTIQTIDQVVQLLFADVRRCAATEVSKAELPPLKGRRATKQLHLFDQSVEIDLNLVGIFVRVDFEIAKLAALAAERNVEVETEWFVDSRRLIQCGDRLGH